MRVALLFLTALIPGLYHMATGVPIRGALLFGGVLAAANTAFLLAVLPPFPAQNVLVVVAIVGAALVWAAAVLAAAARHRTFLESQNEG